MALRNLTTQSMVAIGTRWLDPNHERPIIERYPLGRAVLEHIARAQTRLIDFQRKSTTTEEVLRTMSERLAALDNRHDRLVRGIYGLLTSLAELEDDEKEATRLLDLRDELFPEGLRAVTRSYLDQAGETAILQRRLDDRTKSALLSISTPKASLYRYVENLIHVGRRIGDLETERVTLAKTSNDTTRADVVRARHEWIRTVNALRASLELDGVTPEDYKRIFGPLEEAEAKADRRAQSSATESAPSSEASPRSEAAQPPAPHCEAAPSDAPPESVA